MKFKEGHTKIGGREKGTPNKRTAQWEMFVEHSLSGGLEKFRNEFAKLEGRTYVDAYLKLLDFLKPKLKRQEISATIESDMESKIANMTSDERESRIQEILRMAEICSDSNTG